MSRNVKIELKHLRSCLFRIELTSGPWRSKVFNWFSALPWSIGHLLFGLVIYLIPNMKHLELFIGLSALPFMSLWFLLPESPRWLLSKGRNEEAITVLKLACKWNKRPLPNINDLKINDTGNEIRKDSIKQLLTYPAVRRNCLCMWYCWFACFMGYFGMIYNTPDFDWNVYLVFVFPAILSSPFALVMPFIENRVGRKRLVTFSHFTAGTLLLLTAIVPKGGDGI